MLAYLEQEGISRPVQAQQYMSKTLKRQVKQVIASKDKDKGANQLLETEIPVDNICS